MQNVMSLENLEQRIGYCFSDKELLKKALRHSSYINENDLTYLDCNERLEFLGDSVLEIAVSWYLYESYPEMTEGELTKLRSSIVCEKTLAEDARQIGLGRFLMLGNGEEKTGGRNKDSLLADALEALIGAIFLDGGSLTTDRFIMRTVTYDIGNRKLFCDHKTELQEKVQKYGPVTISYDTRLVSVKSQDKAFRTELLVNGKCIATGVGSSKKGAEQRAAEQAIQNLQDIYNIFDLKKDELKD